MNPLNKHPQLFTGSKDQKQYHQGLRSALNPTEPLVNADHLPQQQKPIWSMHKQGQSQQSRKVSTGSLSDEELAAMPVEKQFETDYDQTGHLFLDTENFTEEQDMVGASNDDFHRPHM